jgi:hypothetical protein
MEEGKGRETAGSLKPFSVCGLLLSVKKIRQS